MLGRLWHTKFTWMNIHELDFVSPALEANADVIYGCSDIRRIKIWTLQC